MVEFVTPAVLCVCLHFPSTILMQILLGAVDALNKPYLKAEIRKIVGIPASFGEPPDPKPAGSGQGTSPASSPPGP